MFKDEAEAILDSRQATYGNRVINMEAAATMVEAYLRGVDQREDTTLTGADFAMIMALYKIYRFAVTPDYQDNIDDVEGYLRIVRECMSDQLIEAKTAEDYQRIKRERAIMEHPASGNAEKQAEEAAMNAWEKIHYGIVNEMVERTRNSPTARLFREWAPTDEQVQSTYDQQTGEQLAKTLREGILRERTLAESEAESQVIAEERRIWRQDV